MQHVQHNHAADRDARDAFDSVRLDVGPGFALWLTNLIRPPAQERLAWLSENESRKASRFVFERDRRRYLAAHGELRALLSSRLAIAPEQLEFEVGPFGKPRLTNSSSCAFNLSHSEDVAVVLISDEGHIGVDVEMLRPVPDALALAQRNFSDEECAVLAEVDIAQRDLAFLAGWTRKEACLKAIGSGLSIAPQTFSAGLAHVAHCTLIRTPQGIAEVTVRSFVHEQRMLIAWARLETLASD